MDIFNVVAATLAELGLPAPTDVIQTMLMKDRYFVGWKCRYDGGHSIWLANDNAMKFYAEDGKLLKTVTLEAEKGAAA